jgi:hypothetical protein
LKVESTVIELGRQSSSLARWRVNTKIEKFESGKIFKENFKKAATFPKLERNREID